jgi:N-methylhydantoinase A
MSAFGMFTQDLGLEYARSCFRSQSRLDFPEINGLYADMRRQAREDFTRIGIPESQLSYRLTVEMRYAGQFHEVEVDLPAETLNAETLQALLHNFHTKYESMFTYSMAWRAAEFLTFRLRVTTPPRSVELAANAKPAADIATASRGSRWCLFNGDLKRVETPAYDLDRMEPGHQIVGPAIIDDKTMTVLVIPGFTCEVDPYRNLLLRAQR